VLEFDWSFVFIPAYQSLLRREETELSYMN